MGTRSETDPLVDSSGAPLETMYYQDPEVRQTLRQYLASPQRFDEALEFGFPRSPPGDQQLPIATNEQRRKHSAFDSLVDADEISDASSSVYDSDTGEDFIELTSLPDSDGPVTPLNVVHPLQPLTSTDDAKTSGPTIRYPFKIRGRINDDQGTFGTGGRDMTLRMTLTRPELRATEEELYGWQSKLPATTEVEEVDPLSLASIPITDDTTGTYGAFAVRKSNADREAKGFHRLLKTVKKR